jgi:uncharacterized protein YmfQ (DUF2313 family)
MSHRDVLALLIPMEIGGVFADDLAIEGAALDATQEQIAGLQSEMYPDTSEELLTSWEALFQLSPPAEAPPETRRATVTAKLLATGDIKPPYFVQLAEALGYSIRIEDYTASMSAWHCAGSEVLEEPWSYFEAGVSGAGDTLSYEHDVLNWIWEVIVTATPAIAPSPALEEVLNDLKPAHIQLNFTYL